MLHDDGAIARDDEKTNYTQNISTQNFLIDGGVEFGKYRASPVSECLLGLLTRLKERRAQIKKGNQGSFQTRC